jgi:hypothetical protein
MGKSHRLGHSDSISFDRDAEFIPCNWDESGKRFPQVALDIQPTMLSGGSFKLCTIAESPLREAEATQSVTRLFSGRQVDELNPPSSDSFTSQAVTDSPKPGPSPISRIGEIPTSISPSTDQDPLHNQSQARGLPQSDFPEGPVITTETKNEAEVPRSEPTNEVESTASFYEMAHSNSRHHVPSNSSPSTTSSRQLPLDLGHIE